MAEILPTTMHFIEMEFVYFTEISTKYFSTREIVSPLVHKMTLLQTGEHNYWIDLTFAQFIDEHKCRRASIN